MTLYIKMMVLQFVTHKFALLRKKKTHKFAVKTRLVTHALDAIGTNLGSQGLLIVD